jgi:hypothetical protein
METVVIGNGENLMVRVRIRVRASSLQGAYGDSRIGDGKISRVRVRLELELGLGLVVNKELMETVVIGNGKISMVRVRVRVTARVSS